MALFFDHENLKIPLPESSNGKEVFCFFGLCVYWLQVFEKGLVNLLVGLKVYYSSEQFSQSFLDELYKKIEKKTLGQLLAEIRPEVRQYIKISPQLENSLENILKKRNYIVHYFFEFHDVDFMSHRGRTEMIEELREIIYDIQSADREVESITQSLWKDLGLTTEMVQKEITKMYDEAKRKDSLK